MTKPMGVFLAAAAALLFTAVSGLAAPSAPGFGLPSADKPLPTMKPPADNLQAQAQLFMPKNLTIHGFKFEVVSWSPGATMKNASGMGKAGFAGNGNTFELPFSGLEIQGDAKQGEIVKGTITKVFNPKHQVAFGALHGFVKKLYLTPGDCKVDLEVPLPTLWTREKAPGGQEYLPAKQARVVFENFEVPQDLEIYLPAYADHKLGEVGIGDTNIIMDCAGKPLFVDLSVKQPLNNSPGLTGVGFANLKTVPQPERANTNIGYCFAEYLVGGAVGAQGFLGQLTYQSQTPWVYTSSLPLGYQITLSKGSLNLAKSAIAGGVFFGNIQLPESVTTQAGARISCAFNSFAVDADLNLSGLLPYKEAVYWGRAPGVGQTPGPASYYLQTEQPALVYFPGAAGGKADRTVIDAATQEEKFVNIYNDEIYKVPGVTFARFNLGILTKDANNKPIELPFESLAYDPAKPNGLKGVFRPLNAKYGNTWWLNVGKAGMNGRVELESALGRQDLAVALGYPGNVGPNTYTANKLFKGFLHAKETTYQSAFANDNTRKFGHFFQAAFVDGAVFDLGIDGHFEVEGPAAIKPDLYDLSATSTADLTSARVEVNAELKYWGVTLKTENSLIVPRVSRVFFLGSQIEEKAHYTMGFPVVWGEMNPLGDIPVLLFGYGTPQYFDGIPLSYTHVELTTWPGSYPPDNKPWGALTATGDLFVPFFGAQNMTINDHKFLAAPADWEKKQIKIDVGGKDYFSYLGREWGGGKGSFTFKTIKYHDGPEIEDGFRGDGYIRISDFKLPADQGLNGSIAITSLETLVTVAHHGDLSFASGDNTAAEFLKLTVSDVEGDIHITSDDMPMLDLSTKFKDSEMMSAIPNAKYKTTFRPDLTVFDATGEFALNFAPNIGIKAQGVHLNVTLAHGNFYGRLDADRLEFTAGNVGGFGGGGFGIVIGPAAKVFQGYGTVTINGVPWPLPNSGGGALVLAYRANPNDLYALGYVSLDDIQSYLPVEVTGFYLACKVGYNYEFAGLGSAWIYFTGGAGLLLPEVVFHSGIVGGVEVCGIGLESGAEIGAHGNMANPLLNLRGTLHYELSLLFFDFSWTKTIELRSNGTIG